MSVRSKKKEASFDVIVVGGGMTGMCAAIASARHGAKTALVQERPVFGGNASSEIRMHICGASANMVKPNAEETGILREILLENKRVNDYYNYSVWDRVLFTAIREQENLSMFLNTTMHDVDTEGHRITAIHCYQMTTEIEWTLRAPVFCDCTGNGTLGFMAGMPFRTGSEGKAEYQEPHAPEQPDQHRMGNTLLFKAVDRGHPVAFVPPKGSYTFTEEQLRYRKHADAKPLFGVLEAENKADPILDNVDNTTKDMVFDAYCLDYGYWWIELTGEKADIIEEYEDIRDELIKCVYGVWDHIKNGGDHGAQNFELEWVGMLPGVRESRRLEGDYMLNENDVLGNRIFDDAVAYGGWHVDNHVPGGLYAFDKIPSFVYEFDGAYTIPYRSYLAKGFKNLYIGGRALSASKLAMATSRVMGTCAIGGQAIGTAAAQAIQKGCDIRAIDIAELQQTLIRDDCYIPGFANTDKADLAQTAAVTASSAQENYPAANVLTGVTRDINGCTNAWHSDGLSTQGEWLQLSLAAPAPVRTVQLVFDSNFNLEKKISLSSRRIRQQQVGVPVELARDYDVALLRDGKVVACKQLRDNYQRLCHVQFEGEECDTVRVTVRATNGISEARIFEVRVYA